MPDGQYYKNSVGLDDHIVRNVTGWLNRLKVAATIATFMVAQDPYLMQFIREFTYANQGRALFTGLKGLGEVIFEDYEIIEGEYKVRPLTENRT